VQNDPTDRDVVWDMDSGGPKVARGIKFICSTTETSNSAIAERPRDARVTSIRKIAKWNF